jgi:hypothetical protein
MEADALHRNAAAHQVAPWCDSARGVKVWGWSGQRDGARNARRLAQKNQTKVKSIYKKTSPHKSKKAKKKQKQACFWL